MWIIWIKKFSRTLKEVEQELLQLSQSEVLGGPMSSIYLKNSIKFLFSVHLLHYFLLFFNLHLLFYIYNFRKNKSLNGIFILVLIKIC